MNPKFLLFLCFSFAVLCWSIWIVCHGAEVAPIEVPAPDKPAEPTIGLPPDGMVLIPAGEFEMGSNDADADNDEQPVRAVFVDAFYMDATEVTNAEYKRFVEANPQWQKDRISEEYHSGAYLWDWKGNHYPSGKGNHPVVYVSWYGAMAYAAWAGKRLPTEAEWEYAARGGLVGKRYSWGNMFPSANYVRSVEGTTAVGSYPANGYGLHDMAGNVWEWCLDKYKSDFYLTFPRGRVARNPFSGVRSVKWLLDNWTEFKISRALHGGFPFRVLRGGSFAPYVRVADRFYWPPAHTLKSCGFRCVRTITPDKPAEPVIGPPPDGMVLIPAGEFQMGSHDAEANGDEQPVHTAYVDAFYMDKYEVTNADYAAFLNKMGKHSEEGIVWYDAGSVKARIERVGGRYEVRTGYENHPVTEVSWYGAMAYALSVGKRLPTEAEWEYAARGGLIGAVYPWGNAAPDATHANFGRNVGDTVAVGSYPANGYGLHDMVGNVWEWCLDEYNRTFYSVSPARNPLSGANSIGELLDNWTSVETLRMLRGGSWFYPPLYVRVANRFTNVPWISGLDDGFRCVRTVTP